MAVCRRSCRVLLQQASNPETLFIKVSPGSVAVPARPVPAAAHDQSKHVSTPLSTMTRRHQWQIFTNKAEKKKEMEESLFIFCFLSQRKRTEEVYMSKAEGRFLDLTRPSPANICGMLQLRRPFLLKHRFIHLRLTCVLPFESVNDTGSQWFMRTVATFTVFTDFCFQNTAAVLLKCFLVFLLFSLNHFLSSRHSKR